MTGFTKHIRLHMLVMGESNAVNLPLVFFETFMAQVAFGAYDVDLMRQINRALGVALAARSLGSFMTDKTILHPRPIGLRGHFIVHDIVMADGTLAAGLLDVHLMRDDDFHHVMFEGLDIILLQVSMTAEAIRISPFGFRLVIAGNPLGVTSVTLGTVNFRVDQRLLQEGNLPLPVVAGQTIFRPGRGEVSQAQE